MCEKKLSWQEIANKIKCPFSAEECKRNEGINQKEKRIENDTVLYVAECKYCGRKAVEWGYDQFASSNGWTPR